MTAGSYDITVDQRTTLHRVITWKQSDGTAVDLTNYTAHLQVRTSADASSTIFDLRDGGAGLTLGGAAGTITIDIPAEQLAAVAPGTYEFDLLMAGGSAVLKLVSGEFVVLPTVTATGVGSNPLPGYTGVVVRKFRLSYDMPHLSDGVGATLFTPTIGDVVLFAITSVVTPWDAVARLDFGPFPDDIGGWLSWTSGGAPDMTRVDSSGGGLVKPFDWEPLLAVVDSSDPVRASVTVDGSLHGGDPGATQGEAILYLVLASPQ